MMVVYRIQDEEGRGPFRPGFSSSWLDEVLAPGQADLAPWMEEFGNDAIDRLARPGERYFGSAVRRVEHLGKWFSPTESLRLAGFGYRIARISHARILAESPNQLLIGSRFSFRQCVFVPWPAWALV